MGKIGIKFFNDIYFLGNCKNLLLMISWYNMLTGYIESDIFML